MGFNYTWRTKDYFDMDPGIQQGLAMRAAGQRDQAIELQRDQQKQQALDRAVADQRFEQARQDAVGEAAGRLHGRSGASEIDPNLGQNPGYIRGFMTGARERQMAEQAMELERQRQQAAVERAKIVAANRLELQKQKQAAELPPDPGAGEDAAYSQFFTDLDRAEAQGQDIDIERDKQGFPKVSKSWMWDDADDPASFEARRREIQAEWEAARKRRGGPPAPDSSSRTNSLPVLRFPPR